MDIPLQPTIDRKLEHLPEYKHWLNRSFRSIKVICALQQIQLDGLITIHSFLSSRRCHGRRVVFLVVILFRFFVTIVGPMSGSTAIATFVFISAINSFTIVFVKTPAVWILVVPSASGSAFSILPPNVHMFLHTHAPSLLVNFRPVLIRFLMH